MNYKLYKVIMDDGYCHETVMSDLFVATSSKNAIISAREKYDWRDNWNFQANEIEFDGFILNIIKI